jgi:UDP-N-acetylmuramyl tripeptide synthase
MLIFNLFSILAKLTSLVFKTFNLGSGTTFISNIYLKFFESKITLKNFSFKKGIIFVTGTNGKTSTTKIISQLLENTSHTVLHNETGGNILRSILGMFMLQNKIITKNVYDYLVLEIDEASVLPFTRIIKPTQLVILNFSRDQLDRYFEIENISLELIKVLNSNKKLHLIFNEEDEYCSQIAESVTNEKLAFKKDLQILKKTNYSEIYMASNLSAVITLLNSLDIKFIKYEKYLKNLQKPYGRSEKIIKKGKEFELHLAKNPASFNHNLVELIKRKNLKHFLIVLNDNVPDGKDISWIYDIEPELLSELLSKKKLYFSGKRAYEMANRIQYASDDSKIIHIDINLKKMFNFIFEKDFNEVIVLCNYSSMLEVRKILTGRRIL